MSPPDGFEFEELEWAFEGPIIFTPGSWVLLKYFTNCLLLVSASVLSGVKSSI